MKTVLPTEFGCLRDYLLTMALVLCYDNTSKIGDEIRRF